MTERENIIGWRRTDNREVPETFEITSSTDPATIDVGNWEAIQRRDEQTNS